MEVEELMKAAGGRVPLRLPLRGSARRGGRFGIGIGALGNIGSGGVWRLCEGGAGWCRPCWIMCGLFLLM